ncbi:MAG: hypothetical protein R3E98_02975 [Gemmatimonadota bacterium]
MLSGYRRAMRYSRAWAGNPIPLREDEITVAAGPRSVPATLFVPARPRGPLPGWVVLHGLTRPGRAHPSLLRFCRALASSPAVVLCPEVPEWRELRLAPREAQPIIRSSVLAVAGRPETEGPAGLLGFSFGAPQALLAATDPAVEGTLGCVAGFGGFFDLDATLRFLFTGHHAWEGRPLHRRPDPYGRWVVGANYLTAVPGYERAGPLAEALHTLAVAAGERQIESWDPAHDPVKDALRAGLPAELRPVWDVFAPAGGGDPTQEQAAPLAHGLAEAIRADAVGLEPRHHIEALRTPVRLLHGSGDALIPYTETLRAGRALSRAGHRDARVTITGLFAHSGEGEGSGRRTVEALRLLRGLAGVLGAV